MPGFFRKINNLLIKILEIAVILVMAALLIDVLWGVFGRHILNEPPTWTEELATILLIWVSLLGASIGFIRKSHLGVDYFVGKLSARKQIILQILVYLLTAVFAIVVLIYGGIRVVHSSYVNERTSAALQWYWYKIYLVLPISGFFIFLFSVESVIKNIASLLGKSDSK